MIKMKKSFFTETKTWCMNSHGSINMYFELKK